ncbi:MAG: hypothetical protein LAQ69_20565 [Acidobacteriia bacterium]|nr:hypothetical protein [Terriglobia bacterium]
MSFHWLEMRISEEQERRQREAQILDRLPRGLEEIHSALTECIESFTASFGAESADMRLEGTKIRIAIREQEEGKWQQRNKVEISANPTVPGFQIERGGEPLIIEMGMLPGDKLFYRDREHDQYLSMEELTRRILDRALFPDLGE